MNNNYENLPAFAHGGLSDAAHRKTDAGAKRPSDRLD